MPLEVEVIHDLSAIEASRWDRLCGADDPFVEHAFLRALEESGTVGGDSGWTPAHILVRDGDRVVGALPLYAKTHSYGEYIFDWAWASAAHRMGKDYYPKLVSMVPVTPATGRRFLVEPEADEPSRGAIRLALLAGVQAVAKQIGASSIHLNFLAADELRWLAEDRGFLARTTYQFHWDNAGYATFDDYLATFRAKLRKEVKRERRKVAEAGLDIKVLEGPVLGDAEWSALARFYYDTCGRKGSDAYLTPEFFVCLRASFSHRVVAALAYCDGVPVAGTLNFEKGGHLFGRYWGARADYEALHFELCYYRLIERCIERGLRHFEAGAQGQHKVRRGLLPVEIHSAHWLADPDLRAAVAAYLPREAAASRAEMGLLADHGPFRRGACEDPERPE